MDEKAKSGCEEGEDFDWNKEWSTEDWMKEWETKQSWAHKDVYKALRDNIEKLTNRKSCAFFIPMCADMYDMKWLHDQGHTVVGIDIAEKAAQVFYTTHNIKHIVEDVQNLGKAYKSADGRLIIYVGDVFKMNSELTGGAVDVIYDVGAMQALNPSQRGDYIDMLHQMLKPESHLFVNLMGSEDIPDEAENVPPHFQECYAKLVSMFLVERVSRYKFQFDDPAPPEMADAVIINNFYLCKKN